MKTFQLILKRIFDFVIALFLLILTSPFVLLCALAICTLDGFPVFFTQLRPGYNEKIFKIYKFRTMKKQTDHTELSDSQRMTPLGAFIRKASFDELPQLLNVLKGDLSLVGPRPLLVEYLPLYNDRQKKRHSVQPGITGWAQINGRNAISWEQKFEYDIWYVENWSLLLDIKIIFITFLKIFKASGVNASNDVTMEKFKGSV
jgi:undecaprenyl phosphate N,N'-diacetylbacillosamine 1-phosphate transferase